MKEIGSFSVCGIPIKIRSKEKAVEYLFNDRYGKFLSNTPAERSLDIFFDGSLDHSDAPNIKIKEDNDDRVFAESSALRLMFDKAKNRGTLHIADYYIFFPVENALRALYSRLISNKNSVLVHAAAIKPRNSDLATLFPGESGAGKTTLSKIAREAGAHVLGDDLVFLSWSVDHWRIESSPFTGQDSMKNDNISAQLHKIAFLKGRNLTNLIPLQKSHAVAALVSCMPFHEAPTSEKSLELLDVAGRIIRSVPTFSASHKLGDNPESLWNI